MKVIRKTELIFNLNEDWRFELEREDIHVFAKLS